MEAPAFPLSYGERALWLTQQLDPNSSAYNIGVALRITEPVDTRAMRATLQEILDHHLVLQSSFVSHEGEPVRRVHPVRSPLAILDADAWTTAGLDDEMAAAIAQPFDLGVAPLLRAILYLRESAGNLLLLVAHHMVFDGGSLAAIIPELRARYLARLEARPPDLPPESATYADYVTWQSALVAGPEGARQRDYWHAQLAPEPPVLELLSDRPRQSRKPTGGGTIRLTLDEGLARGLRQFARHEHTTLYTVLLSAFEVLLHRYSGQDDLLIGAPMAGRTQKRFRGTVGYCVNPVPLRASLAGDPTVRNLVALAHATVRGARHNQDYPIARLIKEIKPNRDVSRSPLFDVLFNYLREPAPVVSERTEALRPLTSYPVRQQEGQFDLVLDITENERLIEARLRYSSDLFDRRTAELMASLYRALLETITANPDARLSELPGLEPAEERRLRHLRAVHEAACHHGPETLAELEHRDWGVEAAPRTTPVEEVVCAIYAEVLGDGRVGPNDDFFSLGGDSLQATQVIARVATTFGVDLPIRTLFEQPKVRDVATTLERCLRAGTQPPTTPPVEPGSHESRSQLSYSQERLWFIHALLADDSSAYNIVTGVRLQGSLDVAILQRAIDQLARRHETLRTSIAVNSSGPIQVVAPEVHIGVSVSDLSRLGREQQEAELRHLASDFAATPFDLRQPPLVRLRAFRLGPELHVLVIAMHHIVSDAWSIGVLLRELAEVYQALREHRASNLRELPMQFRDFAAWQRAWLRGQVLQQQLDYWQAQLAGISPLELPTDRPRPITPTSRGAHVEFDVPSAVFESMRAWSRRENATPFMACLAAFASVLHRYTMQPDIAIGVPIANRRWLQAEDVIGPLVNMLVLRTDFSAEPTARELLHQVRSRTLDAYSHQDIPFDVVVAHLQPDHAARQSPLYRVMFDYINTPLGELRFGGSTCSAEHVDRRGAQVDLTLIVIDTPQVQRLSIEFNTDLFDTATVERLAGHLLTLLAAMQADPDQTVARLPMLPERERQRMLVDWNCTSQPYPREMHIQDLISEQSRRSPDAVAVVAEGSELTYCELEQRSSQLAAYLRSQGVDRGQRVALHVERGVLTLIALLGVLKAGAAYVPVDPTYPLERQRFVIEDSGAVVVLTQHASASRLSGGMADIPLVCLDDAGVAAAIGACDPACPPSLSDASDVAYVIYTSGSTGQPKGVVVSHRNVANLLHAMRRQPGLASTDRFLAVTTLSFDIAVLELLLPLITGARVVLASSQVATDALRLAELLESSGATCMQATPVTWRMLLDVGWRPAPGFKAICGGEPLPPQLATDLLARDVSLWNAYGPTETSIWSTVHHVTHAGPRILIGRPIANTRAYVLDPCQQPCPIAVWGELYIGGDGVAQGYLHAPELTRERFLVDPFAQARDARMYRTGDVARFMPDGVLDVLGRVDQQVKIRGHRIELAEIEARLRQQTAIDEACVALRAAPTGECQLVAYVTPASDQPQSVSGNDLRESLREHLPEVMVPSTFVWLESMPRTPNGKLDRGALPTTTSIDHDEAASYLGPRDDVEAALAREWEDLLGHSPIGVHDNFFDLGGHSLLAIRLVYRLLDKHGWQVPLASFLHRATIAEMASLVRAPLAKTAWRSLVEIQTAPGSLPVFLVHDVFGDVLCFADVVSALGPNHTVFGLRARGLDGIEAPHATIEAMAHAYIEEMRTVQPRGPYRIVGTSAGGSIAYEIACQLEAADESVTLLAILDHPPAGGAVLARPGAPVRLRRVAAHLWNNASYWLDVFRTARTREKPRLLADRVRSGARAFAQFSGRRSFSKALIEDIETTHGLSYVREWPEFRRRLLQAQLAAVVAYHPRPFHGRLLLFRCQRQPIFSVHDRLLGWGAYARGGVEVVHVPGSHRGLLRGAGARLVGMTLSNKLAPTCWQTACANLSARDTVFSVARLNL
ncbi:MAG: amino acid adenylation domain-containing protein [Chloroflexi bacterium]|nr:amino acid adenylation domain-containing protein [Chloroflexota bacterium]